MAVQSIKKCLPCKQEVLNILYGFLEMAQTSQVIVYNGKSIFPELLLGIASLFHSVGKL